jgi:Arc/MetJ-type ribon-helix-helix transcriptional regulator
LLCYTPIRVLEECHMKIEKDKVTIKIPRPIYENLAKIIEGSGFNSVTEFIVYILRDLISSRTVKKEPSLTRDEIKIVKERLKSLGYL